MSGIVESVGKSVTRFRPGDSVFGETIVTHEWTNGGAFAEYVSVRQDLLALKPDNVTFEQAASVPTSGFIVLQNLRNPSQLRPGQKVLVNGAGGDVGALALQLAKAHGAHVTAVDSTTYKGEAGFQRYVGWCVISQNLVSMARTLVQRKAGEDGGG